MGDQVLDIQYDKVAEWLISRRKLREDWTVPLSGIRAKVNLARKEHTFEDQAAQAFLSKHANEEEFDFFKAEELFGLLEKSKEGQKRTMLNQYATPSVKAWASVLDAYKRNCVHLAEAARTTVQFARYDIPSMKNQAQACRKQIQDATRKQKDLMKSEVEVKRRFRETCQEHEVSGIEIRAEFQEQVRTKLPKILGQAADMVAESCATPLAFYCAFTKYTQGEDAPKDADIFPTLRFVMGRPDATLKDASKISKSLEAEWKKVQADFKKKPKTEEASDGGINWGGAASGGVDWGITSDTGGGGISWDMPSVGGDAGASAGGGISWDFAVEEPAKDAGKKGKENAPEVSSGGIDWASFSMEGIDLGVSGDAAGGVEVEEGEKKTADNLRLLENSIARATLLDEIMELEAFLAQRSWEIKERGDAALVSAGADIQRSAKEVKDFHKAVTQIVELLCGKQTRSLLMMQTSETALSHAVSQLETQRALCERPARQHASLEKRKAELTEEADKNTKEVERIRKEMRRIKDRMEEEIGKLVKHKVRIVGDINTV